VLADAPELACEGSASPEAGAGPGVSPGARPAAVRGASWSDSRLSLSQRFLSRNGEEILCARCRRVPGSRGPRRSGGLWSGRRCPRTIRGGGQGPCRALVTACPGTRCWHRSLVLGSQPCPCFGGSSGEESEGTTPSVKPSRADPNLSPSVAVETPVRKKQNSLSPPSASGSSGKRKRKIQLLSSRRGDQLALVRRCLAAPRALLWRENVLTAISAGLGGD